MFEPLHLKAFSFPTSSWLQIDMIAIQLCHSHFESLTPHVPQPGWLPSYMLFTNVLKHDFADCCPFHMHLILNLPLSSVHIHGSCTQSHSCLYIQRYFQTEPVKDIQPVVNMVWKVECWCSISPVCLQELSMLSTDPRDKLMDRQSEKERTSLAEIQPGL